MDWIDQCQTQVLVSKVVAWQFSITELGDFQTTAQCLDSLSHFDVVKSTWPNQSIWKIPGMVLYS